MQDSCASSGEANANENHSYTQVLGTSAPCGRTRPWSAGWCRQATASTAAASEAAERSRHGRPVPSTPIGAPTRRRVRGAAARTVGARRSLPGTTGDCQVPPRTQRSSTSSSLSCTDAPSSSGHSQTCDAGCVLGRQPARWSRSSPTHRRPGRPRPRRPTTCPSRRSSSGADRTSVSGTIIGDRSGGPAQQATVCS